MADYHSVDELGFCSLTGQQILVCVAVKMVGLNHLVPTRQQKPLGLLVLVHGLPRAVAAAAVMGEPSLQACAFCYSWTSGSPGPSYAGAQASLAFRGAGSRKCSRGEHGALNSCVCWGAGFTSKCRVMEPGAAQRL
jgi:hypothetical protein